MDTRLILALTLVACLASVPFLLIRFLVPYLAGKAKARQDARDKIAHRDWSQWEIIESDGCWPAVIVNKLPDPVTNCEQPSPIRNRVPIGATPKPLINHERK